MSAKKSKETGPTLGGVAFFGVVFAIIGALLGFGLLFSNAPKAYHSTEEREASYKDKPDRPLVDVSYVVGPVSNSTSWEQKRKALLDESDTTVAISIGEINAWLSAKFRSATPAPVKEGDSVPNIVILPGVPNFALEDNQSLSFHVPTELIIRGERHNCIVFAKGVFTEGFQVGYKLDSLHINSAAIPVIGGVADRFVGSLLLAYAETDEYRAVREAWEKVDSVELIDGSIQMKLR